VTTQAKYNRHRCRKRIATATWLCQQYLKAPWTVPAAPVGGPSNPAAWCRNQGPGGRTPPDKQTHIPGVEASSTCSVASAKHVGRVSQSSSPQPRTSERRARISSCRRLISREWSPAAMEAADCSCARESAWELRRALISDVSPTTLACRTPMHVPTHTAAAQQAAATIMLTETCMRSESDGGNPSFPLPNSFLVLGDTLCSCAAHRNRSKERWGRGSTHLCSRERRCRLLCLASGLVGGPCGGCSGCRGGHQGSGVVRPQLGECSLVLGLDACKLRVHLPSEGLHLFPQWPSRVVVTSYVVSISGPRCNGACKHEESHWPSRRQQAVSRLLFRSRRPHPGSGRLDPAARWLHPPPADPWQCAAPPQRRSARTAGERSRQRGHPACGLAHPPSPVCTGRIARSLGRRDGRGVGRQGAGAALTANCARAPQLQRSRCLTLCHPLSSIGTTVAKPSMRRQTAQCTPKRHSEPATSMPRDLISSCRFLDSTSLRRVRTSSSIRRTAASLASRALVAACSWKKERGMGGGGARETSVCCTQGEPSQQ
jgi:hypothetical protein